MSESREMSYFEHMLLKKVWPAYLAVGITVDVYLLTRSWKEEEVLEAVAEDYRSQILNKLGLEEAKEVFVKRKFDIAGWDGNDNWIEGKLDVENSDVDPERYINWLHKNGYYIPYDFKVKIKVEKKEESLGPKAEERMDKAICQGIARTLWDIYPDMTIEEMHQHRAIQVYGGGKAYPGEGTLRGWLRVVDPRKKKSGPKKKS